MGIEKLWIEAKLHLLAQLGRMAYGYWGIEQSQAVERTPNGVLRVRVRDQYAVQWMTRCTPIIKRAIQTIDPSIKGINFQGGSNAS